MNCLDCGEQFGSARPAVGVCVVCGAGVCRPHADVRIIAKPVQSGLMAVAVWPHPRRAVRCLACRHGANPPPWPPPVRGRRRLFGGTAPAAERR